MGREVRKVPPNWEHPKNFAGRYKPLFLGPYSDDRDEFLKDIAEKGYEEAMEWHGSAPSIDEYMPEWPEDEATHLMMYENTSEGTPISPAFETPEELARWLADNGASAFAGETATYGQWLAMIGDGFAVSAMYSAETGLISGVAAAAMKDDTE